MNEIKKDLDMSSPKKNIKHLACLGCHVITDELCPLNVDGQIILMCPDCKESLSAILENEDYLDTVSFVQKIYRDGVNKTRDYQSSAELGIFDTGIYMNHIDC